MDEDEKRQYLSSLIRQAEEDRARRQIEKREGPILTKPMVSKVIELQQGQAPLPRNSVNPIAPSTSAFAYRAQPRRPVDGFADNANSAQLINVLENSFMDQLNGMSQVLNACTSRFASIEQQVQTSLSFRGRVSSCESEIVSLKDAVSGCPKSNEVELQLSLLQRKCMDAVLQEITKSNIGVYSRCDQVFAAVERRLEETVRQFRSEVSQIVSSSSSQLSKVEQECRQSQDLSQSCIEGMRRLQLQHANSESQHQLLAADFLSRASSLDDKLSREVSQISAQMQLLQNNQSEMFQNLVSQYSSSVSTSNSMVISLSQRLSQLEEAQLSAPSSAFVHDKHSVPSEFAAKVESDRFEELNERIRNLERKLSAHEEERALVSDLQADIYSLRSRVEELDSEKITSSDPSIELKSVFSSLVAQETEQRVTAFEHLSDCISSLQASIEPVFDSVRVGVDADTQVKLLQSKMKMLSKSVRRMEEQHERVASAPIPQPSSAPVPRDFAHSPSRLSPSFSASIQNESLLDRFSELKLQIDLNNEKIEQAKAEFSKQLEAAKDQFRDSIVSSTRFFELKASSMVSEVQQTATAVQSAQESSQQKFKHLAALIKKSEEFLYSHILTAEDKSAQLGQMLNVKHAQDRAVLDQKIENILTQVSAIESENLHFRALSDSRISSFEQQFQSNLQSAAESLVSSIEATRRDLSSLEAKVSHDSQTLQKRSADFDSLESSCATVAKSVSSMMDSITNISGAHAVLAGQSSNASKAIQEIKSQCQHVLATANAIEEKIEGKFQPQFVDMADRIDAVDAQLASLSSGSQQRLEKRLAVIRDEISGHTSHSNRVFDRIQKELLEMQEKLSKLSVEIVGSAQRADLSHQSLKETLLPSVSSLQASVNSLSFRLSRSLTEVQEDMNAIKSSVDSTVNNLACDAAVFSCLEDVISRIESHSMSSKISLLHVQASSAAAAAVASVTDKVQKLELSLKAMDSDQISAADLFSQRLASAEDSISATTDHLELVNTQNTLILTNIKSIEAKIESHSTEIGVVVETVERSERTTDALSKEIERLSVASTAAATRIESQTKAIGVVEETVGRTERTTDALSKEIERLSVASTAAATRIESQTKAIGVIEDTVGRAEIATDALSKGLERQSAESNATVAAACLAIKEDILQHLEGKISSMQADLQVQEEALQELLDTVSKQQAITNDFIAEVRAK
jgi:chromosome segregation ATPase